jgi:hypothetical protein
MWSKNFAPRHVVPFAQRVALHARGCLGNRADEALHPVSVALAGLEYDTLLVCGAQHLMLMLMLMLMSTSTSTPSGLLHVYFYDFMKRTSAAPFLPCA